MGGWGVRLLERGFLLTTTQITSSEVLPLLSTNLNHPDKPKFKGEPWVERSYLGGGREGNPELTDHEPEVVGCLLGHGIIILEYLH